LQDFLSADLRHHGDTPVDSPPDSVDRLSARLHELLQRKAREGDSSVDDSELDEIWAQLVVLESAYPLALVEQLTVVGKQCGQAELLWGRVARSWSWFLGKPVRFVERLFGHDV
jgi:hypothetical protein